ncbi:response regulator transcription factor [Streptomyces griseiscabiei]|uniref:Sensory transduction protein RegX3 n=1 Tax=Streptomyces griseiscabiei TaxID=2993540 RepID=A0ABU4L6K6_9ACTN|nr:response regulator transcription factor [Streptomyces griseiscabiei]MBZ3906383.1 response regulator transcription factor [Streptomyces griseiscabiei]MDX2911381.1 response regulator transcription factor [Streptomyces griseiscabiei]
MRVLIVEDHAEIADALRSGLNDHGFETAIADTCQTALERYADVDAVLLDVGLPDGNGMDVCRTIRASSSVPIIMVSGRDDEFDRVLGLRMGADDYVVKPCGLRELVARIEAVVRRAVGWARSSGGSRVVGPLSIDLKQRRAFMEGAELLFTRKEFDLLVLLTGEPGKVFDRETIMRHVWGQPSVGDTRTLGVHMVSLRRKLGAPELIQTVRGVGFRFAL